MPALLELAGRAFGGFRRGRTSAAELPVEPGPHWPDVPPLTVETCRAAFEEVRPFTIGIEEELMLVSPATLDLAHENEFALEAVGASDTFHRELRASQLEIVTGVCDRVEDACHELATARRQLVEATRGRLRIMAAGTHPFATDWGELSAGDRYRMIEDEYVWAARRSYVCGLHVHVAVGGADRALAVFNALRSYMPELGALGANSPFYEGEDTGLSSIRPKLTQALPRTGVPPSFASWHEFIRFVDWGRAGGLFADPTFFWWDLRPHPKHGTVELRVADSQTRVEDAVALAALAQCLVAWLSARFDHGERLPVHERHRIEENAWRAQRYGVSGHLVDLDSGSRVETRERIARLLDELVETSRLLGCEEELLGVRALLAGTGSDRQRYVERHEGMIGLAAWLARETERLP